MKSFVHIQIIAIQDIEKSTYLVRFLVKDNLVPLNVELVGLDPTHWVFSRPRLAQPLATLARASFGELVVACSFLAGDTGVWVCTAAPTTLSPPFIHLQTHFYIPGLNFNACKTLLSVHPIWLHFEFSLFIQNSFPCLRFHYIFSRFSKKKSMRKPSFSLRTKQIHLHYTNKMQHFQTIYTYLQVIFMNLLVIFMNLLVIFMNCW